MPNLRGFWKEQSPAPPKPSLPTRAERTKAKKAAKKRKRKERKKLLDNQWLAFGGVVALGKPHPDYKQGDDSFYKSREWRALRYVALKNCDGRCQCCGASAADGIQLHVDHIVPRYKAPHLSLDIRNLQVLCENCNIGKVGWDETNWRDHFKSI